VWAGSNPRHLAEQGWWLTLSGVADAEFNMALAYETGSFGQYPLERCRVALEEAGVPAMVMVAGPALGDVGLLVDTGWVCVRSVPVMAAEIGWLTGLLAPAGSDGASHGEGPGGSATGGAATGGSATGGAVELTGAKVDQLRGLVASVFVLDEEIAALAVPGGMDREKSWRAFGVEGEDGLVSGGLSCLVGPWVCLWSMATRLGARRHGYGRQVLRAMIEKGAADGASAAVLISSPLGKDMYSSCGFETIEHWQAWSRPGWVIV